MPSRVIRIVGAPASGKSTLRRILADELDLPSFAIDDERLRLMGPDDVWPADDTEAWRRLRAAVDASPVAIVETSGHSPNDADLYRGVGRFTILVTADARERRRRLLERVIARHRLARTEQYVGRTLRLGDPVGLRVQAVWPGDRPAPVAPLLERLRGWLASTAAEVA